MKVSAILKGKQDTNGKFTIYIRINEGKKRTFRATKMKASVGEWDEDRGRCKSSHPQASLYNAAIKKKIVEVEAAHISREDSDFSDADLFTYILNCIDREWIKKKAPETLRQNASELNKLKAFTTPIRLSQVTVQFLNRYRQHLYSIGNSENTTWKSLKFVRTIIRKAHRERVISDNPFSRFDMPKYRDPEKGYLTEEEITRIENYSIDPETKPCLSFAARWFVIGCYTGLRFGDMRAFNKEKHVRNGRLTLYTKKTGEIVSIKFKPRLRELFDRVEFNPLHVENQVFNRHLKEIQSACRIKTTLTAHVSRHTFGVLCSERDIDIKAASDLLGHSSVKTTAIYYKISPRRMDAQVDKLF
jgi:site-specific recombinase XerD